jgi:replicative DNA helicase
LWVLREWLKESAAAMELCYGYSGGLEDLLSKHAAKVQRMADFSRQSRRESLRDQAKAARAAALKAAAGQVDRSRWLTFGLPHADACFQHFDVNNEDWYAIVAGPPSGGKSTVMRQVAGANCVEAKAGVVFLLETSLRRWLQALAAAFAHVDLRKLHELPKDRLAVFDQWMQTVEAWVEERLWIFDDIYHLEDIERVTREVNRRVTEQRIAAGADPATVHGLDFAIVDYLQLIDLREKFRGQREEKIGMISKGLKKLFKSVNITGLVGSQLNRKAREEGRHPRLTDLRESGSIEQDADVVLAVHTPAEDKSGAVQDGTRAVDEVELLQLKRRNGPRDVAVDLLFYKTQGRYVDAKGTSVARPGLPKPPGGYKGKGKS